MSELVLTPTKVLTEGFGSSNAPYVVASDVSGGQSFIAWTDGDDASYAKSDAGRSARGNYPLWSDVDGTIDPTWVTAIGVRFRAKSSDVTDFVVQLFGQVSKLLSNPFIGAEAPLTFAAVDTWEDFDYVVADVNYDTTGWAPDGVQSALAQTFIYCRTVPTDSTGEFTASGVVKISEQAIVVYYAVPDPGDVIPPVDSPPPYGGGSAPPPDSGGPTGPVDGGPAPQGPAAGGGYQTPAVRRQTPTRAQVVIDGHWLTGLAPWGDLTWSHVWPGGSGNATWTAEKVPAALRKRGLLVQLMMGMECIWSGPQTEPDPTGATMNAAGLWTIGVEWAALDSDDNTSVIPDEAIDAAIDRGMPWLRRDSISTDPVDIDTSQGPVTIGALLDAYALSQTQRWGVTPDGHVICIDDPADPSWHVLPLDGGLTPADQFATRLIGRYFDGSTYTTVTVTDDPGGNGIREATVDLTGLGTLTPTKATNTLHALLDLGLSRPSWANPIACSYGDILSAGQVPVGLERPVAGDLVRVHGHIDETQTRGGRMWTDVLLGQTDVTDHQDQLTLTPMGMPARELLDVIALFAQTHQNRSA